MFCCFSDDCFEMIVLDLHLFVLFFLSFRDSFPRAMLCTEMYR